jgi:hypothetical protein
VPRLVPARLHRHDPQPGHVRRTDCVVRSSSKPFGWVGTQAWLGLTGDDLILALPDHPLQNVRGTLPFLPPPRRHFLGSLLLQHPDPPVGTSRLLPVPRKFDQSASGCARCEHQSGTSRARFHSRKLIPVVMWMCSQPDSALRMCWGSRRSSSSGCKFDPGPVADGAFGRAQHGIATRPNCSRRLTPYSGPRRSCFNLMYTRFRPYHYLLIRGLG